MFVRIFILMAVTLATGVHLPERITFDDQHNQQYQPSRQPVNLHEDKTVAKREAAASPTLSPQWGFLPFIASPPVIQVHHIVQIQSPDNRCIPFPPRPPSTPSPLYPPPDRKDGGIEGRFGDNNQTTAKNPSPCVWAIVSCCSPGNANIRYACFELLGCQGAFWDLSPCEPRVVQAAANTALMFYMAAPPINNQSNVIDFEAPESDSGL